MIEEHLTEVLSAQPLKFIELGPGLLESAYEDVFCELHLQIRFSKAG
jgi:hypothetical protein